MPSRVMECRAAGKPNVWVDRERRGERRSKLRRAFRARAHTHFPAGQLLPRLDYLTALSFSAAPSLHHWVGDQSSPKFPIQRAMRHCHLFNGSLLHISIALKLLFEPISKSRMLNIRIRGQPIICLAVQPQKCNFDEGLARGVQIVHS